MRNFGFVMLVATIIVGALTCPTATCQQVTPQMSSIQQHAYFDPTSKWTRPSIYVCWENPDDRFKNDMNLVRSSVAASWEAASALRFTGWRKCADENAGIRILINDSGPRTLGLGRYLDGVKNGMLLNFTFDSWSPSCKTSHDFCVLAIAVHEFGHAIGFAHEQNRPDAPGECQQLRQGPNGTLLLTPYDPHSVMNYCNAQYNNNGKLSQYDTEAVQNVYGPSPGAASAQ